VSWSTRLLLVDDDADLLVCLKTALEERGYRVDASEDPRLALERCAEKTYDLVLLDWDMPRMSGAQVAAMLRTSGWSTPILFVTGWPERVLHLISHLPEVHLLPKPVEVAQVVAAIERVLSGPRAASPDDQP
jgi:two-component system, OmpR family, manganese sensing response regulator